MMSLQSAMLTSYERYRAVFTPMQRLKRKKAFAMYIALWIFALIYVAFIMAVVPGSSATLGYTKGACMPNFYGEPLGMNRGNMVLFYLLIVVIFPCVNITGYHYIKVYYELNRKAEQLSLPEEYIQKMRFFARSLIFMYTFLLLCWTPLSLHVFLVSHNLVGEAYYLDIPWGEVIGFCLCLWNSAANPILVLLLIPEIKASAQEVVLNAPAKLTSMARSNAIFSSKRSRNLSLKISPSTDPYSSANATSNTILSSKMSSSGASTTTTDDSSSPSASRSASAIASPVIGLNVGRIAAAHAAEE